jgi:hypothetical protein
MSLPGQRVIHLPMNASVVTTRVNGGIEVEASRFEEHRGQSRVMLLHIFPSKRHAGRFIRRWRRSLRAIEKGEWDR